MERTGTRAEYPDLHVLSLGCGSGDWHPRSASVTLRLPARCLDNGNYGAEQLTVLTEGRRGDTDLAPDARHDARASAWIPRG